MKVVILGTRGIPNFYGGFEQFAQYLSEYLVNKGHEVIVYNSHTHPYQENDWNGVKIVHCKDPEDKIGTAGQFIYDLNCIIDSRKRDADIILQLGYASSAIWYFLLPKKSIVITNMDGLEWKRRKFSKIIRSYIKFAEWLTVKSSQYLISDSIGIQSYLQNKYSIDSKYIPYGANLVNKCNKDDLQQFSLEAYNYNLIISRMEPENNIEIILQGFVNSESDKKMVVVGSTKNKYGKYVKSIFSDERIVYLGYISEIDKLNVLRNYSNLYFHGHSVGGTNPSLLEAMSSNSLICAHNNKFNKAILGMDAFYFNCNKCITFMVNRIEIIERKKFIDNNLEKIKYNYSWEKILSNYESFMQSCLKN